MTSETPSERRLKMTPQLLQAPCEASLYRSLAGWQPAACRLSALLSALVARRTGSNHATTPLAHRVPPPASGADLASVCSGGKEEEKEEEDEETAMAVVPSMVSR